MFVSTRSDSLGSYTAHHRWCHPALSVSPTSSRALSLITDHASAHSVWYAVGGHRHYKGPASNRPDLVTKSAPAEDALDAPHDEEKARAQAQIV